MKLAFVHFMKTSSLSFQMFFGMAIRTKQNKIFITVIPTVSVFVMQLKNHVMGIVSANLALFYLISYIGMGRCNSFLTLKFTIFRTALKRMSILIIYKLCFCLIRVAFPPKRVTLTCIPNGTAGDRTIQQGTTFFLCLSQSSRGYIENFFADGTFNPFPFTTPFLRSIF